MKCVLAAAAVATAVSAFAAADGNVATNAARFGRMDRTKFHIFSSSWINYPLGDEARIREIADCGIDVFCANWTREGLDLCLKYGIGALVRGHVPKWWGGHAEHNGKMAAERPISLYEENLAAYAPHPAVVGFEIGDEPSALDFEHYGKVAAVYERETSAYLNLFPNYASVATLSRSAAQSQLGAKSYEEYIASYCRHIPIPDICFDNYTWGWHNTPSVLYENLRITADACQATHRSLLVELQMITYEEGKGENIRRGRKITEGNLRWQSNAALAFGCRQVNWINWQGSWWGDHILDLKGNLVNREMYETLKRVNVGLRRFGDILVRFERSHTDFVGFDASSDGLKGVKQDAVPASHGVAFSDVKAADGSPVLVGHFISRSGDGRHAMFVVSCDDPHDRGGRDHVVRFRAKGRELAAFDENGRIAPEGGDGEWRVPVRSNHGVLVVAR